MSTVREKRPSEYFGQIIKVARTISAAVGADIANPNYHFNGLTFMVICTIVGYFGFTIWTIVQMFEEDWKFMLEASCMVGSVLQGTTKLIFAVVNTKKITATRFLLEGIYKEYEQKGPKYDAVLHKNCDRVRQVVNIIGISYLVTASTMVLMPFILMLFTNRRYLMMHFHLPGLDVTTNFGFFVTTGAHTVCMYVGAFGLFAGDLFVVIYLTQCFLFADIFKLKVEELNELVSNADNNKNPAVTQSLIDIVKWHQLYSQFTETCNDCFYYMVTVQVTTAGISIVLTLFVVLAGEWAGAYPYLAITFYNLYVYCILGTKIEICNDDFSFEIYNISWYNMTVPQQKIVRLMLMQSQSPQTIDVAGCMPLSVNTALQITKTIYSISMMMIQFLVE